MLLVCLVPVPTDEAWELRRTHRQQGASDRSCFFFRPIEQVDFNGYAEKFEDSGANQRDAVGDLTRNSVRHGGIHTPPIAWRRVDAPELLVMNLVTSKSLHTTPTPCAHRNPVHHCR